MAEPLLSVRDLCVDFVTPEGLIRAVDRVSLEVERGELLGLAGESGCGKSTVAQAVLRILPPPAVISGGAVAFGGEDVLAMDEAALRGLRWRRVSMVFQSAMDALNPVLTVGEQIVDTLRAHRAPGDPRARAAALLEQVGIPADRLAAFPHQLSGGMRQRVAIAIALALEPSLVVLDEPTTALDVVVERDILQQLLELRARLGFSVLLITHDLERMLQVSDRVAILYAGRIAEVAPAAALRDDPRHPYARGLLRAFPTLRGGEEVASIPGAPPSLRSPPPGCRFHPRCERADARCRAEAPPLAAAGERRAVACFHPL